MNGGYSTALQKRQSYARQDGSDYTSGVTSGFVLSLAPLYPSIAEELKKDVAMLASSLKIRDDYIDNLRKARDSLASKLDFKLMQMESLERQIRSYQKFLQERKTKETYQ